MHTLPAPFCSALRELALALAESGITWRLGGSAMLRALGLDVAVGDLDVTVAAEALDDVRAACVAWPHEAHIGQAPPPWCSEWLVRVHVGDVGVDVIGGLCLRTPDGGRVVVPQDGGPVLDLDGVEVPLADPAVWWWLYGIYRPSKADALARIVPPADRDAVQRRLGVVPRRS